MMKQRQQKIMAAAPVKDDLRDGILCAVGMVLFACLIPFAFPLRALAFLILFLIGFIITRNLYHQKNSAFLLVRDAFSQKMIACYLVGLLMGVAGAMYYKGSIGLPVFPSLFRSFALVAMCIGAMEEIVFRGFIQGRLSRFHPGFAIVFAAFAHASYKAFLFLSPASQQHLPVLPFYTWTFGAFILIGFLRYYSGRILPAIIVHAIFDLLVYSENVHSPWWVW
jgi:membrane protease YdiL (CAAX protease family)